MPIKTLIIIPAFNEAENLPSVMAELRAQVPDLGSLGGDVDVVVINDCSRDETAAVAAGLGAHVVSLPCNLGYGGAVQTGFKYGVEGGYDYCVMLDADGQHDPGCIPDLLRPVVTGESDIAIGSRFLGSMEYATSGAKQLGHALFRTIVTRLLGRSLTDPTSGFQAMNRLVFTFFSRDNYPSDYPDADTVLLLHYAGFRVTEVPVRMRGRISGVSMHSGWKTIYYVFKMFLSIFIIMLRQRTQENARRSAS